ncbi:MAG: uncharacterized protein KVP18_002681 [Porospora cf. gigantea A]|uniref:uncharacterized protein n=1 Tax=Porospora cf. gigantea A TaxID=2853593 RepID=UPI00355A0DF1|nr:MAG: hypothetical protein KVP18_002681 [Porospora cf. gigantea A]
MGAKHCLHHDAQHVMALCSFVQVMWMLLNSYNAGTSPSRVNYYVVSMSCLLCSITAILRHKADAAFLVYFCVLAVSGGNAITSDNTEPSHLYLTAFFFASGFEVVVVLAIASVFIVTFVVSTQIRVSDGNTIPPLATALQLTSAAIHIAGSVAIWIADRELEHLAALVLTQPLIATDGYDPIQRMEEDIPVARCERLMRHMSASWLSFNTPNHGYTLNNGIVSTNAACSDCMPSQVSRPFGVLTEVSPSTRPLYAHRDVRPPSTRSRRNTVMKVFSTNAWATTKWRTRVRRALQFCDRHCRYLRRPPVSFPLCEMPPCAKFLHRFLDNTVETLYGHWATHHLRYIVLAHIQHSKLWMLVVPIISLNLQFNVAFTIHLSNTVGAKGHDHIWVSALWCISLVMSIGHLTVVCLAHRVRWVSNHGTIYWWTSYVLGTIRLILVRTLKTDAPIHVVNAPLVEYLWIHLLFEVMVSDKLSQHSYQAPGTTDDCGATSTAIFSRWRSASACQRIRGNRRLSS